MAVGTRFVRNWLTGELEEVPRDNTNGRTIIARETPKFGIGHGRRAPRRAWQNHVSRPLSLKPEECTPERIEQENADAKYYGTGAYYTRDGLCHLDTRGSRARELRRKKMRDGDGGYSD